ncbi:MAG: hypothetical protein R2874_11935 [Desulfobacterales bacterium]
MHKGVVHFAFAADDLTQSGLYLIGRHLPGVPVVDAVEKAAFRAHAAVSADGKPGADAGFAGFLNGFPQLAGIHFQGFHFLVILPAAGIGQQFFQCFFRLDGNFVAQCCFGH